MTRRSPQVEPSTALALATTQAPAALALVPAEFSMLEQHIAAFLRFDVVDEHGAQYAADGVHAFAGARQRLEQILDWAAGPVKLALKSIEAEPKRLIKLCENAEKHGKRIAEAFIARRDAEIRASLAHATTREEVERSVAAAVPIPEGLTSVEVWGWEPTGEPIDPSYYVLDTARLDREARALKANLAVPGIRPVRRDTLRRSST